MKIIENNPENIIVMKKKKKTKKLDFPLWKRNRLYKNNIKRKTI